MHPQYWNQGISNFIFCFQFITVSKYTNECVYGNEHVGTFICFCRIFSVLSRGTFPWDPMVGPYNVIEWVPLWLTRTRDITIHIVSPELWKLPGLTEMSIYLVLGKLLTMIMINIYNYRQVTSLYEIRISTPGNCFERGQKCKSSKACCG